MWSLQLLEFIASQPILNTHPIFTNFLFDTPQDSIAPVPDSQPLGGPVKDLLGLSVGGEIRKSLTAPELSDLEVVISPNISIDNTRVLSPVNMEPDHQKESQQNLRDLVAGMAEVNIASEGVSVVPDYIREAAEHVR